MTVAAEAPGKIILCGEHAVVYGRPAIAVPVSQVWTRVTIEENDTGLVIHSVDLNQVQRYADLDPSHPLGAIIRLALYELGEAAPPRATVTIESTIPIASGLGSGAAVSTAIVRALARFYRRPIPTHRVSHLVYRVERLHHGTPSGIDNTVIAYGKPVYFVRQLPSAGQQEAGSEGHVPAISPALAPLPAGERGTAAGEGQNTPIKTFDVPVPFRLAIADTGVASPTRIAVGDVRQAWEADQAKYDSLFDRCGEIANAARDLIQNGRPHELGPLLTDNHRVLREMGVSCDELDALVGAAIGAGALGAKLSGGGRGGNMIALMTNESEAHVRGALLNAGAKRVITTTVGA